MVALRSLSLKPISLAYKTPPIRFSQAGGQSAHKARPPNLELALTPPAVSQAKVEMFSKYERQKDKRNYKDRKNLYVGPCYVHPPERIKPSKSLKWNEAGMPTYEDLPEGEAPPPAAAEAGGDE